MVHEHHLTVARTARYYTLGEPGPDVAELWVACHGYGQLAADFVGGLSAVASPARLIVAPEGLSRYYLDRAHGGSHAASRVGASWMTREDRAAEIADQVAYLDAIVEAVRARSGQASIPVTAFGFSQGAATIARWLVHSSVHPERIVFWGSPVPEDVLAADHGVFRRATVYLVAGARDEFATPERMGQSAAALRVSGVAVVPMTFQGGHRLDDETLARVASGVALAGTTH